ncbi:hypothetical protein [Kitasatospora sp. NPDC057015]|uniref:hypothetical protein n=1 Tax=Kitasatospora sp. NPDC057015 TaxID=3346001 RepID=UPI003645F35E
MEATPPGVRPHLALTGFVLLLVAVFGVAFALGGALGPVAPGLRPPALGGPSGDPGDGGSDGTSGGDVPGMSGHGAGAHR